MDAAGSKPLVKLKERCEEADLASADGRPWAWAWECARESPEARLALSRLRLLRLLLLGVEFGFELESGSISGCGVGFRPMACTLARQGYSEAGTGLARLDLLCWATSFGGAVAAAAAAAAMARFGLPDAGEGVVV